MAAVAAMGISGKGCSIFPREDSGPAGISVGDAEVEGQDKVDDVEGLMDDDYHGMDIDLLGAISPPTDGLRVIEPNHQPTVSRWSHDHTSPLFMPECTPEALPHQPLFLHDSEDEQDPIHLVRQAPFSKDLICKDYHVYDNHYECHIITSVIWVSRGSWR